MLPQWGGMINAWSCLVYHGRRGEFAPIIVSEMCFAATNDSITTRLVARLWMKRNLTLRRVASRNGEASVGESRAQGYSSILSFRYTNDKT